MQKMSISIENTNYGSDYAAQVRVCAYGLNLDPQKSVDVCRLLVVLGMTMGKRAI